MAISNQALQLNNQLQVTQLFRRPTVTALTGKSRSTLYRDIKKGLFTKPINIGGDRVAWASNEVQAINQARIAGKSDEEIKQLVADLESARQSNVLGA